MHEDAKKMLLEAISNDYGIVEHRKCKELLEEILKLSKAHKGYHGLTFKDLHQLAASYDYSTLAWLLAPNYFNSEVFRFDDRDDYGREVKGVQAQREIRDFIVGAFLRAQSYPKRKGGVRNG